MVTYASRLAPSGNAPAGRLQSAVSIAAVPAGLFLFALSIRAVLAALHPDPGYPDSAYYVDVARNIAAGKGFSVDFLWTFIEVGGRIPADPHLPVPSNPHWAPLASMVQVPFIWLLGPSRLASLLPFVLVGALGAPLAWAIARDAGSGPLVQIGAGFLGAVPGLATVFTAQQDNFALTMVLGGTALWATSRGLRGHRWWFVGSGVLVGLATLARTDGILLAAAPAAAVAWDRGCAWRKGRRRYGNAAAEPSPGRTLPPGRDVRLVPHHPVIPAPAVAGCLAGFLVVVGPWWIRQLEVFGSISPSTSAGILWLRSFSELDSVTAPRTLSAFLAQPIGDLVGSRVGGLAAALIVFGAIVCAVVLVPFAIVGAWRWRRSFGAAPALVAGGLLLVVSALLFAIHVPNGQFLHASIALAPHTYWLAMDGIVAVGGWAAKRAGWRSRAGNAGQPHGPDEPALPAPRSTTRVDPDRIARPLAFGVLVVFAAGSALAAVSVGDGWETRLTERRELTAVIDQLAAPADRLMSVDSATFRYLSGHGGIVTPDDPLPVIEQAARAYDVRWLVLERDGIVPALAPVLDGTTRPGWIGPVAYALPGTWQGSPAVIAAIFPVCFGAPEPGCAPGGTARAETDGTSGTPGSGYGGGR